MPKLDIDVSKNVLTIRDESSVLFQIGAGTIIIHMKTYPKLVDQNNRDWSKDIREAPESERPEFRITYFFGVPDRTIDLFLVDEYVTVRMGDIVLFQQKAGYFLKCDREGVYDNGWDPLVEAIEFTLRKKGNYQYIENHNYDYGREGDLIRIDLDSGDRVNISELERTIKTRKNPPNLNKQPIGLCGCLLIILLIAFGVIVFLASLGY